MTCTVTITSVVAYLDPESGEYRKTAHATRPCDSPTQAGSDMCALHHMLATQADPIDIPVGGWLDLDQLDERAR